MYVDVCSQQREYIVEVVHFTAGQEAERVPQDRRNLPQVSKVPTTAFLKRGARGEQVFKL